MIDNCLGVTAIGLGITGVGLLSTIVGTPAVIEIEAVSIVMGLLRVVRNQTIKKLSLKIEKHEKIAILAISSLNTISSLISKALSDEAISDEDYSLILLEFKTFTRMKEDLREKIAMLAVSSPNTISSLLSKLLSDDSISDEEYSLILLDSKTFT